ncbi:MAG: ATP-binding cassette domain-containing protein [Candidatus Nanopelagicaceae bacterium]
MNSAEVISCQQLSKDYGANNGLFGCDLKIYQGEVFGLIGPNGAGKSTLIKLLMNLINPTSGSAAIFGLDAQQNSVDLKRDIGYLPGELMQFPGVTAGYILNLLLNIRGIAGREYMLQLADRLQLDLNRKFQDLSHGNKQKVGIVQAFMHRPKLLILDEPTLGLDPLIQRELKAMIQEGAQAGKTIILSSHVLSEVESYCTRIGLINKGRIIKVGTLSELRTSRAHKIEITFNGATPDRAELVAYGAKDLEFNGGTLKFEVRGPVTQILKILSKYEILEIDSRELSLEEVFFSEVSS